ncbi:MAG TPA: ATP-binding protein, partial [Acidimicrobiales bacterium]|nr:ATP-binding protein [Acidimicrobiales bacterium]
RRAGGPREGYAPAARSGTGELAGELGRHLEKAGAPNQTLREVPRLVAESLGIPVAIVLAHEGVVEEAFDWPADGMVATHLGPLLPGCPDDGTVLATALQERRTVHVPVVGAGFSLFDGSGGPSQLRSTAAVPLTAGGTVGAVILHSPVSAAIGPGLVAALDEVAVLLGLVVANAHLRRVVSAMQSAQEGARLREELLAALSHDMQTPLAVLLGSVKALQQFDDLAPKHRAGLYEGMARRGSQLQRLVEQFLDYSRLEAGRPIEARPSSTDVRAAIAQVETDMGWRRPLELAVPSDLPPAFVDPDRLNQVLANLVSNALKFSPVGSPIRVNARADDDVVQIVVEDRGRGMSPVELEEAFLKFHRGSGARDTPGTGLGLYVSRAVIEAQGGQLTAESQLGRGTRFTLVLPRRPPGE